ncbi:hypothetical protein JKP88DRAFT_353071 [Tribonema minus]|uniref:ABM domain-containing protein n=1 Tax=Tribonema minus TaxID=303371 RepID=A0A835ZA67_9STRA|nr:hypothetical protein JKP88DRAFT_353071 [Tribonema minus]
MAVAFGQYTVDSVEKYVAAFTDPEVVAWRKENGIASWKILTSPGEPNQVSVIAEYPSIQAAKDFLANPKTRTIMKDSGIMGPPSITMMEIHKSGSHQ